MVTYLHLKPDKAIGFDTDPDAVYDVPQERAKMKHREADSSARLCLSNERTAPVSLSSLKGSIVASTSASLSFFVVFMHYILTVCVEYMLLSLALTSLLIVSTILMQY